MEAVSIAAPLTTVDTAQKYPLGMTFTEPAMGATASASDDRNTGEKQWIYVLNDSTAAAAWAAGNVIVHLAGGLTYAGRKSQTGLLSSEGVIGVAQHAIASGSYGWIQRRGLAEVLADAAGTTIDVCIIISNATAGTCEAGTALDHGFGRATETVAAGLATCVIDCRG